MLEAVTPKITDAASIKGISTLLALPMLCVAYFLQSGPTIEWDGLVLFGLGDNPLSEIQLRRLIAIFVLKSIWIVFFGMVVYGVLSYIHIHVNFPVIQLASVLLVAVAIFGIFCSEKFPQLKLVDPFWFYGLMVWGLFLSSMKEQFDGERRKIDIRYEERKKSKQNNSAV
ncbi:hypothetical protein [Stenotrophomonas rhizophila]